MSLLKGTPRSLVRASACRARPFSTSRRASSMTAESQQKVQKVTCSFATCANHFFNYSYSLRICNMPTPPSIRSFKMFVRFQGNLCPGIDSHSCRRNDDRSILSISFLQRTLLPRLSSMLWEALCKVGGDEIMEVG
jgi:hypothetical protein